MPSHQLEFIRETAAQVQVYRCIICRKWAHRNPGILGMPDPPKEECEGYPTRHERDPFVNLDLGTPATRLPGTFYEGHQIPSGLIIYSIGLTPREAIEALCRARWSGTLESALIPIESGSDIYSWGYRFKSDGGTSFKAAGINVPGGAIVTWWK